MPLYTYECPDCQFQCDIQHMIDRPSTAAETPKEVDFSQILNAFFHKHPTIQHPMFKVITAPGIRTINKGNHDFASREKERLTQRATEHWNKKGRDEAVDRARAKGHADAEKFIK